MLTLQLMYGAFMAGLKAAKAAATWPDINGVFFPSQLSSESITDILFFNPLTIHFIHRTLAYLLFVLIIVWYFKARKNASSSLFSAAIKWPLILVIVQVLLGIFTVLTSTKITAGHFGIFELMAQLHQLIGMLLLMSLMVNAFILSPRK